MRTLLSAITALCLLMVLSTLAVMARPNDFDAPVTAAPDSAEITVTGPNAEPAAVNPAAPVATLKSNNIGLPLDVSSQMSTANDLATYVGSSVQQVGQWNPTANTMQVWYPALSFGTNFNLTVGGNYWLGVSASAPSTLSFLGGVPAQGYEAIDLAVHHCPPGSCPNG